MRRLVSAFEKRRRVAALLKKRRRQCVLPAHSKMNINPTISEWLNLLLRWTHVFAGIM